MWTAERRTRQSELIRTWKPWARATGPRTPEGKAKASRNAFKGAQWLALLQLRRAVNAEIKANREFLDLIR